MAKRQKSPILLRWSDHVPASDVQDPLGLGLRVSTRVASRLLYCITSITPRARYFSFIPWCILDYRQREKGKSHALGLRDAIILREQALTLACIAHHNGEPCAGGGLVGSRDAKKWFAKGGKAANFKRMKNFSKNPALGAYYNSLVNLGLFVTDDDLPDSDDESDSSEFAFDDIELSALGLNLAKRYDSRTSGLSATKQFASKERSCTIDGLAEFGKQGGLCELSHRGSADRELLRDIFFALVESKGDSHRVRRRSLLLTLDLCRQFSAKDRVLNEAGFAGAVYFGEFATDDAESTSLQLTSALLTEAGELRVRYRHRLATKPSSLRVAIRTTGEQRPRALNGVPNKDRGTATFIPPESALKDAHGTILASLVADVEDKREESPSMWVIQEGRLTYEPSDEESSSAKSNVQKTGDGLTEFLEQLGKRDGVSAVIEYLRHLNIRFNDGIAGLHGGRMFRIRIRDPFHPDVAPEWLLQARTETGGLAKAIKDFADRHEKQRLRKHAKRGNINGMENFLDIFTTLVRLLYVYNVRGTIPGNQLIGRLCNYLDIATSGIDSSQDFSKGYLYSLYENLGDAEYLQEVCDELNFLGHIRAAFVIAQKVRYDPGAQATWGTPTKRPSECLPDRRKRLKGAFEELGLNEPSKGDVMKALEEYKMFSATEMAEFDEEITV